MSAQEKIKRQSEKLAKQSFALLARIKAKRQNMVANINEENYIEDLYMKVFKKCSPHFKKLETSNEIFVYVHRLESDQERIRQEHDELMKQSLEMKAQMNELKEIKDETLKIKLINVQLNRLEQEKYDNLQQIKALRRENVELSKALQTQRKAKQAANEVNLQLESFLEKLTKQLEEKQQKEENNGIFIKQISELERQVSALCLKLQKLEQQKRLSALLEASLLNKNNTLKVQLDSLMLQLHDKQTQLVDLAQNRRQLVERQEQLKVTLSNHEKQQNIKKIELEYLLTIEKESSIRLQSQCKLLQNKILQLSMLNESIQERLNQALTMNQQSSKNFNQSQQQIKTMVNEKQRKEREIVNLKAQVTLVCADLQTQKSLLINSQETHKKITKENEQLQRIIIATRNQSTSIKQKLQSKIDELKERLKFFKQNNEALNNEKIDLIANIELLAEETKTLANQIQAKENELANERQGRQSAVNEAVEKRECQLKNQYQAKMKQIEVNRKQCEEGLLGKQNHNEEEQIEMKDTVQVKITKANKHIETIGELSAELTQAYRVIQELQATVSKLNSLQKSTLEKKSSVQKKERGRSIKKIAGMFGF